MRINTSSWRTSLEIFNFFLQLRSFLIQFFYSRVQNNVSDHEFHFFLLRNFFFIGNDYFVSMRLILLKILFNIFEVFEVLFTHVIELDHEVPSLDVLKQNFGNFSSVLLLPQHWSWFFDLIEIFIVKMVILIPFPFSHLISDL